MLKRIAVLSALTAGLFGVWALKPISSAKAVVQGATGPVSASSADAPAPAPLVIPRGTMIHVRLNESITTMGSRSGDKFDATLTSPLVVDGQTVAPRGAQVRGVVRESEASGRLKGRAVLSIALDRIEIDNRQVPIETASHTSTSAGHKKRNLILIGGGSGAGALIGGLAGGGVGALIGAGAGSAAGLTGAVITGKRQLRIPAETALSFRLQQAVRIA